MTFDIASLEHISVLVAIDALAMHDFHRAYLLIRPIVSQWFALVEDTWHSYLWCCLHGEEGVEIARQILLLHASFRCAAGASAHVEHCVVGDSLSDEQA